MLSSASHQEPKLWNEFSRFDYFQYYYDSRLNVKDPRCFISIYNELKDM